MRFVVVDDRNGYHCQHCCKPLRGNRKKYCSKKCGDEEWIFEHRLPADTTQAREARLDVYGVLTKPWRPGSLDISTG